VGGVVGGLVLGSFVLEVQGWTRLAHAGRLGTVLSYAVLELAFLVRPREGGTLGRWLRVAFVVLLGGFAAVAVFPLQRVALLHLSLVGGFAAVAFIVATRVVYGHSGHPALLRQRNRWLTVAMSLMLLAMATRISGDFWPKIMITHYVYGALAWIAGAAIWAVYVLPKVMLTIDE
jgi:uncharacterized protein involved in response to NO